MDLRSEFINIAHKNIRRAGLVDLMEWLESTDFYTAPASTRFHGAFNGGLVQHSLNVYVQLKRLLPVFECDASPESVAIVSLFHDLCKVGTYKQEVRWRKNSQGQWEMYDTFTRREDFAYGGHGSKSVFLVQSFMKLTPDEASAINCHMGQWESTTYGNPSDVYERNTLAWLLHVADEAATYTMDKNKGG